MKISSDKPIERTNQDILGRALFADSMAKAIYNYKNEDGLVIGLYGKWGSGKTSVINMVEESIDRLAEKDAQKPIITRFSPWNYGNKNDLISLFFHHLRLRLMDNDGISNKKKLGKVLERYAFLCNAMSIVPGIGAAGAGILEKLVRGLDRIFGTEPSLDNTKRELEEQLKLANKKFVVIIDDIDRLGYQQILATFQLVNQMGNFPNIIYLLVMDKEVVCKVLSHGHHVNGEEYIEKIIQVPFVLPELWEGFLNDYIKSRFENYAKNLSSDVYIDEEYWGYILSNCIMPYVNKLRDVERILNIFKFKYSALYKEVVFEDMAALCTIEVMDFTFYNWLCDNPDILQSYKIGTLHGADPVLIDARDKCKKDFAKLKIDVDRAINWLVTISDKYAATVHNSVYYRYNDEKRQRLSDPDMFSVYSSFNLSNVEKIKG